MQFLLAVTTSLLIKLIGYFMLFFSRVSLRGESSSPEWLTALVIFVRRLNPSLTSTFWKVVLCWVRRLGSQRQFGWIFFLLRWGSIRWLCCCWQQDKKKTFSHIIILTISRKIFQNSFYICLCVAIICLLITFTLLFKSGTILFVAMDTGTSVCKVVSISKSKNPFLLKTCFL